MHWKRDFKNSGIFLYLEYDLDLSQNVDQLLIVNIDK